MEKVYGGSKTQSGNIGVQIAQGKTLKRSLKRLLNHNHGGD